MDLSEKWFKDADVDKKLRAQQLSNQEINQLCSTYNKILSDHQLQPSDAMIVNETKKINPA